MPRLSLLGDILARGKSSRLYQKLVVDRQLAQDASAYQSGRELAGSFGITVTLRPSRSIAEVRQFLDAEISEIASSGVPAEELERVITMKTASFLFALEHMGGFGGVADRLNAYNIFGGDPGLITTDLERFQQVTPADIARAASDYLAGHPSATLSVLGRKRSVSSPPLDRSVPPASGSLGEFHAPVPQILTLSNGIPVWVLPQREPANRDHDHCPARRWELAARAPGGPRSARGLNDG